MQNGKIIESDRTQTYENPREKKVQGVHNGKPFAYIQKKTKFSIFPKKQVYFLESPPRRSISYKIRTPTPYPFAKPRKSIIISRKKKIQKKNPKQNITKNKKQKD
jgi:hypothetical protein